MTEAKTDIKISEEMQLEKEIQEKQQKLHDLRYGEMEQAYKEFEEARDAAVKKYDIWKQASLKHGNPPKNIMVYFNRTWTL